jgi:alpha-beta hydrolase superfamily lysophospholipase
VNSPLTRLIIVPATDGLQLPALFFEPAKPTKRLMIWLHGMGSSGVFYSVDHTNALAEAFTESGTAFLAMQNRGGGMLQGIRYYDENGDKQKRLQGTTHELIAECVYDIDGALKFAAEHGYTELYLGGHSTGANKTALYHYLKPRNPFAGYCLYGGGDDTGLFYEELGYDRFQDALEVCRRQIKAGRGADLTPFDMMGDYFSYQSAYDILNPDGDYNTFPFFETQTGNKLSTKPLFREYKSINKPTLVIYGEQDEYCLPNTHAVLDLLKRECSAPDRFTFALVPGADHSSFRHETKTAHAIADWVSAENRTK